jgi:hypothetical protein
MKRINAIDNDPKRRFRVNMGPYLNGKVFSWTVEELGQ